jgi:septal ring factor EnvC (AmiA/AmiB activator)
MAGTTTLASQGLEPILALSDGATAAIIALVAGGLGMGLIKLLDYLRKEAAVEAREMALKEKARLEAENEEVRRQLHERERKLDKSEDALQSRADQLAKQEKMVESNQRRLAEKLDDANRRQKELDDLLDL